MKDTNLHKRFSLIILFIACVYFTWPLYMEYAKLNLAWADVGSLFSVITNFFQMGSFYSYDWKMSHFNIHFTPFFLIMALALKIYEHVLFFISLHGLALGIGAFFLYKISYHILKNVYLACVPVLFFCLNAFTLKSLLYVHFEVFMVPLLFAFAYFAIQNFRILAFLSLLLALTVKQDVWVYGVLVSWTCWGWIPRKNLLLYTGTCFAYFVLILNGFYPLFYPNAHDRILDFWNYGDSKSDVVLYLIQNPSVWFSKLFTSYADSFERSFWRLPILAGWRYIPAFAIMVLCRSASVAKVYKLYFYYSIPVITLYCLCLPFALANLRSFYAFLKKRFHFSSFASNIYTRHVYPVLALFCLGISLAWFLEWDAYKTRMDQRSREILELLNNHPLFTTEALTITSSANLSSYVKVGNTSIPYYYQKEELLKDTFQPDIILYDLLGRDDGSVTKKHKEVLKNYLAISSKYEKIDTDIEGLLFYSRKPGT